MPESEITEMVVVGGGDGECNAHELMRESVALRFDLVPDQRRHVGSAEILDGANSGGRGDIDFGEIAVDHVDADEQQAALAQGRADPLADLGFAVGQFGCRRRATAHHVGSQVVGRRNAVDRAGVFAIDQDDALVAVLDVGQKFLHHPLLAEGDREHIVERAEIEILAREPKHRFAAVAVERLHHDVAVLGAERLDLGEVARNQCRRHQIGKFGDEHLFGCVAHVCRVIDHQRLRDGCARAGAWWSHRRGQRADPGAAARRRIRRARPAVARPA